MSSLSLDRFFQNLPPGFVPELDLAGKVAGELAAPVESGAFVAVDPDQRKLRVENGGIELFDQPLTLSGDLAAGLKTYGRGETVAILDFRDPATDAPVFAEPELVAAPAERVLAEFSLRAKAGLAGTLKPAASAALTFSAQAAAGTEVRYRHLLPSPFGTPRLDAFRAVLASARLPVLLDLRGMADGEVHVWEAQTNVDLGLSVRLGGAFDLGAVVDLFDGLAPELKAHVDYGLTASLGFSLFERVQIGVGRFNVAQAGWARLRIQRLHRRELTLGAKLDLQVRYDLGRKTFDALFDRILQDDPTPRLMKALRQAQDLAAGGREAIEQRIVAALGEEVAAFVDTQFDRLGANADVAAVFDRLGRVVAAYDGLDAKVRSLWDALLTNADLGPDSKLLGSLRTIAAFDSGDVAGFLDRLVVDPQTREAIDLVESLSGLSVEELLAGEVEKAVGPALADARQLAQQALDFLTTLERVDERLIGDIDAFATRTGIAATIEKLRRFDSLDKVQKEVDARARQLLERLAGKAVDAISDADLERIAAFLDRAAALLAQRDEIVARIRAAIAKLQGELGFSLNVELSRLSERQALVDVEFDPENRAVREVIGQALVRGAARGLVDQLPEDADAESAADVGYRLRESLFSARRVRSSAVGAFFSLIGLRRRQTRRIDEETVRIWQEDGELRREGSYGGGMVRTLSSDSVRSLARQQEIGAWLSVVARGKGGDLAAAYDEIVDRELRITFTREDATTTPAELAALDEILLELGFTVANPQVMRDFAAPFTLFSLDLRFGENGVAAALSAADDEGWNLDYRNAGHRWFAEGLVPTVDPMSGVPEGPFLSSVVASSTFARLWTDGDQLLAEAKQRLWSFTVDGRPRRVQLVFADPKRGFVDFRFGGLGALVRTRGEARSRFATTVEGADRLGARPQPAALRELASHFSTAMARTAAGGWPSVLFSLWLLVARITRVDAAALADARGVASVRTKAKSEDDWSEPILWRLASGVPRHQGPDSLFPIG